MIALVEAQRRVAALPIAAPEPQAVALGAAVGRTLLEAPASDLDLPPFDRVTMDGFAVRAADVAPGRALRVAGAIAAGQLGAGPLPEGAAVRIMTGAPLPAGADAVVPIEEARESAAGVTFTRVPAAGQNVHPRARDLRRGGRPLAAGRRVTPAMVPLLATLGCGRVVVAKRPRVALVATGDELVELDVVPSGAQIRESNRHGLAAQVESAGGEALPVPIVRDDPAAIRAAVERCRDADVVLLTGGSSVGDHDHTHDVLAALRARLWFDAVRIKPGKPVLCASFESRTIFGLPGNPVSAFVTFEVLVRPHLERLAGAAAVWPCPQRALLCASLAAPPERDLLQLARWVARPDGDLAVEPLRWSGSGDLVALAGAGALVHLPQGSRAEAGAQARVVTLRHAQDDLPRAVEPVA